MTTSSSPSTATAAATASSSSSATSITHLPLRTPLPVQTQFPMSDAPQPAPTEQIDPMPPITCSPEPPLLPTRPPPGTLRSQNPSQPPPSKLPSRPRKLRKLSPDSSATPPRKPQLPRPLALSKPSRALSADGEIDTALDHLRNADPLVANLIDIHQRPTFDAFQTPFLALTKSILYQQLAYKAGTSIYSRFVALCGGEAGVVPSIVLELTPQQLRQIGVSARKASYLHDLARKYQNGILSDNAIINMDDRSLFTMLTMVNGIGSWSVHMFMIFSLHRPDVLPVNDLQVRKGVQLLYGLEELPRPSQMDHLCEKWRPYRSVGAWYMWRLTDAKGGASSTSAAAQGTMALPHPIQEQQQMQALPAPHHQGQHQHQHQHQHQQPPTQHQPQFMDPINGIMNIGSNFAQLN